VDRNAHEGRTRPPEAGPDRIPVRASFVVPSWNGLVVLREALRALERQTLACEVVVVDNGSVDGTAAAVAAEFPDVVLVQTGENLGFGRAVNLGAARATGDVLLVVNNDAVCAPDFAERLLAPFADPAVGMAAAVLTQRPHPDRVDSAGVELDVTVGSWDLGWNAPVASLGARAPVGPCGGAAAYRASAWRDAGGFDPALFAYWEDVDLALRLRRAGWTSAFVPEALALHRHGATLGAATPLQRRLDAFGRGFVLGRHGRHGRMAALRVAALDWPVLAFDLLVSRRPDVLRERRRGLAAGRASRMGPPDPSLLTVALGEALRRRWAFALRRVRRGRPAQEL
jgi:N-acetylglucosaminyl-diphospho-decaprenol L-rhamnosyltransferase